MSSSALYVQPPLMKLIRDHRAELHSKMRSKAKPLHLASVNNLKTSVDSVLKFFLR